jgi:hypothetical protein
MRREMETKNILPEQTFSPEDRFAQFQEYRGKRCTALSDLDWAKVKSFLDIIPTEIARVDFLSFLNGLPDDGVINSIIVDPVRHRRNQDLFLTPLQKERARLLSSYFNLERILNRVEQLSDHRDALNYLWQVYHDFGKYHPTTRQKLYSPDELVFCNTIEMEIQRRKDLLNFSPASPVTQIGEMTVGDTYNVAQAGAVGPSAHAHNMAFNQAWTELEAATDIPKLAMELLQLRQEMRKVAVEPEHDIAVSEIAKAGQAAKAGDGSKTVAHLKSAGKWALDVATKIGTSLAVEAIKKSMNT